MSEMRERECERTSRPANEVGGQAPQRSMVDLYWLLVGSNQMVLVLPSRFDRQDFCPQKAKTQAKDKKRLRLPKLRAPLAGIKQIAIHGQKERRMKK